MVDRSAAVLVGDPAWLCHRYDPEQDAFHYRRVERERHRAVPFLIDAALGVEPAPLIVRRKDAAALVGPPARLHFLFHSAFCGSTLLTRALDLAGSAMGLSEPMILNDLVGWRRRGARPEQLGAVMADALGQLARPFGQGEAVVVKPSNVFSGLAAGAMSLVPDARAILLAAPLPVFLLSVARKGLDGRLWVRELLEGLLADGLVEFGFEPRDILRQTDLQVAAVGWLAQLRLFHRMAERFPERVRSLDSERLTLEPGPTIASVASFLGLTVTDPGVYATHPALGQDSKSGRAFAPGERQAAQEASRAAHQDEVEKVAAWAEVVAKGAGLPLDLPLPLPLA